MFILLSFVSAIATATRRVVEKPIAARMDSFSLGWIAQASAVPFIAAIVFNGHWLNPFKLSAHFWLPILWVILIGYPVYFYCYYRSLREGLISETLPLLSFAPVFTSLIAWLFLGERPTLFGFIAMIIIVLAVYVGTIQRGRNIAFPIIHLLKHKQSIFMLITSLSMAVGATLDKVAIGASNPYFYSFMNVAGGAAIMLILALIKRSNNATAIKQDLFLLFAMGVLQAVAFITRNLAISTGFVSYAIAIYSSNILLASVIGAIIFKEKITTNKIISLGMVLIGLMLFALDF